MAYTNPFSMVDQGRNPFTTADQYRPGGPAQNATTRTQGPKSGPDSVFKNAPGQGIFPEYGLGDSYQNGNNFFRTEPIKPGKPTQYGDAFGRQLDFANDLSNNFQKYSDERYEPFAAAERGKLDKTLRGVKSDFNSRGLLNSGLQGDAEANQRASANSRLQGYRSNINQGLLNDINTARGNAFDLASLMAKGGPNTAEMQLDQLAQQIALSSEDEAMASQAYGNLSTGFGKFGGAVAGGRR